MGRGHGLTTEEALAAMHRGEPIHVQGEEMWRFIDAIDALS